MSESILVSTRKGLFEIVRSDRAWSVTAGHFVGDNVTLTLVDRRDGAWYAALDHGHFGVKLHRSMDRGETWSEVGVPAYPDKPEGHVDKTPFGSDLPWKLKLIWSLEPGGGDRPNELWCGTIPGGVFRSRDRGETWALVESLWDHPGRKKWMGGGADYPGVHSILVDPRDSKRVLVGVSCGGVWETRDDGATWEVCAKGMLADFLPPGQADMQEAQDPHLVVACPSDFDKLWTQHHCGIWRSIDASQSWQRIERAGPSTFGFAVAVHPDDPETAWFVPAVSDQHRIPVDGRVVVTRTRDGGQSFEVLSEGLPSEHAYDLTFRHALDVDASGNRLAFGSTTGSVWVSEDQGDSWVTATANLPPIYALTFI